MKHTKFLLNRALKISWRKSFQADVLGRSGDEDRARSRMERARAPHPGRLLSLAVSPRLPSPFPGQRSRPRGRPSLCTGQPLGLRGLSGSPRLSLSGLGGGKCFSKLPQEVWGLWMHRWVRHGLH